MSCWSTSIVSITSKTSCRRHCCDGYSTKIKTWAAIGLRWALNLSDPVMSLKRCHWAIPRWSPDWFRWYRYKCTSLDFWWPLLRSASGDTWRAKSWSSRLLPELPAPLAEPAHLANKNSKKQEFWVFFYRLLANEINMSLIWKYLEFSRFGLFVLINCPKKGGLLDCLPLQISTSDTVGTRFMRPTARGKTLHDSSICVFDFVAVNYKYSKPQKCWKGWKVCLKV